MLHQTNIKYIFSLILGFGLCCSAHSQSYEKITEDAESTLYLEKGSIDRSGKNGAKFPTLRVLLDFSSGLPTSKGLARSVTVQMFLDCPLRRQIITSATYHSGKMGRGNIVVTDHEVSNNDIRDGFVLVYKRVCL
jgi:hypothetical protein